MVSVKNGVEAVSSILNRAAEYLLIGLIAGISILIFVQVVFRYGFNHSIYWSEEVGRYTLIWITFIGASVGFKKKVHVGVDFLYRALGIKTRNILTVVSDLSILVLALVLAVYGIKLTSFVRFQTSAALLIPMSVPYSAIWIGGILTAVHSFSFLLYDITVFFGRNDVKEAE